MFPLVAAVIAAVYGTAPATLGPNLDTIAFGGVDAPALPALGPGIQVELVRNGKRIDGVDITIHADQCAAFQSDLEKTWGTPNTDSGTFGESWVAKSGAQGARFEGNSGWDLPCRLKFFRRVSAQQFLNGSKQSVVPTWAVGRPASELEAEIAVLEPKLEDGALRWEDTAIDGRRVALVAVIRGKNVVRVAVQTDIESNQKLVWDRLVAVYGKPSSSGTFEDTVSWKWRRAPGIEVGTFAGDGLPSRIGEPPRPVRTPSEPRGFPITITFGR